jgi:hypothetical protein
MANNGLKHIKPKNKGDKIRVMLLSETYEKYFDMLVPIKNKNEMLKLVEDLSERGIDFRPSKRTLKGTSWFE